MKRINALLLLLVVFAVFSCKEKYAIQPKSSDVSVLVVEGTLINGNSPTTIKLTRSTGINNPASIIPVSQATVTVESSTGTAMSLTEAPLTGNYIATLNLDATKEYRLRIKTKEGKEYLSDFVPVKTSPPIDSVNWKWENNGIMFYANTHDASNKSKYYKWEYDETWEITSPYYSVFKMVGNVITPRDFPLEDVSHCWKFGTSNTVMIGSTAQLTSDVISQVPMFYLPKNTEKIGVRYSALVKQVVLTKEAYDFFYQMKKNTEQLGSIFDPLPSELRGNIHCVTAPDELVIGYVAASSQSEKRIFISSNEVAQWVYSYSGCTSLYIDNKPDSLKKYLNQGYLPYDQDLPNPFGVPVAYYFTKPPCADCTLRGGTNVKPSYW